MSFFLSRNQVRFVRQQLAQVFDTCKRYASKNRVIEVKPPVESPTSKKIIDLNAKKPKRKTVFQTIRETEERNAKLMKELKIVDVNIKRKYMLENQEKKERIKKTRRLKKLEKIRLMKLEKEKRLDKRTKTPRNEPDYRTMLIPYFPAGLLNVKIDFYDPTKTFSKMVLSPELREIFKTDPKDLAQTARLVRGNQASYQIYKQERSFNH